MRRVKKGLKHDNDKLMWGLLPWEQMEAVVRALTFGAQKYKPNNWRYVKEGERRYFDAALRHMAAVGRGERLDHETKLPHYAHAVCSLLFAFWHGEQNAKRN